MAAKTGRKSEEDSTGKDRAGTPRTRGEEEGRVALTWEKEEERGGNAGKRRRMRRRRKGRQKGRKLEKEEQLKSYWK